jgi:putative OPT family oligopeptide transporter
MNPTSGSATPPADAEPTFKPYVAPETEMVESTIGAIVLGSILGIVFAAASVYAGLKIGLTTSASIPIGVLAITILRAFGKSTILKNNIVQTTGSAGESLAAGVAFTLPSLLLMGFDMDVTRITLVALLGGILGTLMMIPLRHGLIVKEHGKLPYPEGTACAQVLIVGDKGGSGAGSLFGGLFLGGFWAFLSQIGHFFSGEPGWSLDTVRWKGAAVPFFKGGSIAFETNPVLMGTGYIIGWRTSFIMLAGGIMSFLVFIPAIQYFGAEMTSRLILDKTTGALIKAGNMDPGQIRTAFVLFIGAGAVAAGGLISLARALPTIVSAFARGLSGLTGRRSFVLRTERDLPMSVVLFGCIALVFAMWAPNLLKDQIGRDVLGVNWISAILIVIFGFFFVTVSSRITGEIGSSSNPISGMTVATLLITCLLFVAVNRTGIAYKEMALCTAALVCVAASNGGTTSQALKTGFLVGATPRSQQIAMTWGVITSAAVIGFTLMFLNSNFTTYHVRPYPGFSATPATIDGLKAQGRGDELAFGSEKQKHRAVADDNAEVDYDVFYVRKDQHYTRPDPNNPSGPAIEQVLPRGKYLVLDGAIAFYVDPGVCGTEHDELAADNKTVVRHIDQKFDAPKAQLFRLIIDGVLGGDLPWVLVLIGVFVAIMMELCGVPSLAFAVGAYLPISTSASIFLGGLVRKWADKRTKLSEAEQESSPGVLFSAGLIAGGALVAIVACALLAPKTVVENGTRIETTIGASWNLTLANRVFPASETLEQSLTRFGLDSVHGAFGAHSLAEPTREWLDTNNVWGLGCFLVLGVFLFAVAARKPRRPPPTVAPPTPPAPRGPLSPVIPPGTKSWLLDDTTVPETKTPM